MSAKGHKAKQQRLKDGPTIVETEGMEGACLSSEAGARSSQVTRLQVASKEKLDTC